MAISDEEAFEIWYMQYPRRVKRGDARKAWRQTAGIRPPLETMLAALEVAKRSVEWHRADRETGKVGAYIPYPASYLRAECWLDEFTINLPAIKTPSRNDAPTPVAAPPSPEEKQRARDLLQAAGMRLRAV